MAQLGNNKTQASRNGLQRRGYLPELFDDVIAILEQDLAEGFDGPISISEVSVCTVY